MQRIYIRNLIGYSSNTPRYGVAIVAALLSAGSLAGCTQSSGPASDQRRSGESRYSSTSVILQGVPMDLDPAVRFVTDEMDMAVVNIATPRPFEREYELLSATDEPGWLLIRTPDDTPLSVWDQDNARLVGHARLGRFGDPNAELELLRRLNRRLETLAGSTTATP